ncbi:adenosylcobinamide kinase / adenosylcobinamide-phosphate guanylyltransferase [Desulfarculales bacterium]
MIKFMCTSTLILGGAKSGKTALALKLAQNWTGFGRLVYIATAQAGDQEMQERILRHQAERGPRWSTLEEPLDLAGALAHSDGLGAVLLVDCLTLWLNNLMTLAGLKPDAGDEAGSCAWSCRRSRPWLSWWPTRWGWASCRTTPWPGPSATRLGSLTRV